MMELMKWRVIYPNTDFVVDLIMAIGDGSSAIQLVGWFENL